MKSDYEKENLNQKTDNFLILAMERIRKKRNTYMHWKQFPCNFLFLEVKFSVSGE